MKEAKKLRVHLNIDLYEDDLEELAKKCGADGITVKELLENFIGDLTASNHTRNGSDECDYAESWYNRCWFAWHSPEEKTFLMWLIEWGEYDNFADSYEHWAYCKKYNEEYKDQVEPEDIEEEKEEHDRLRELYDIYSEEYTKRGKEAPESFEKALETAAKWTREWTDFRYECEEISSDQDGEECCSTEEPESREDETDTVRSLGDIMELTENLDIPEHFDIGAYEINELMNRSTKGKQENYDAIVSAFRYGYEMGTRAEIKKRMK